MTDPVIDYAAVFQALPGMVALLTPELVYADANEEFLRVTGRNREQLMGRYLFDVFPDNPNNPPRPACATFRRRCCRVLATGERDAMALQRYDVAGPERPGEWEERYWSPVNAPVLGPDGRVVLLCTGWRRSPNSSGPAAVREREPRPRTGGRALHPCPRTAGRQRASAPGSRP